VQECLNHHEVGNLDIEEAGGTYTDKHMISDIVRGLPSRYNTFIDQYYFLQDTEGLANPTLKDSPSRLLTFKLKLEEHSKQKSPAAPDEDKESEGEKDNGKRKKRVQCTFEGCRK
jgi:hypothetical protein